MASRIDFASEAFFRDPADSIAKLRASGAGSETTTHLISGSVFELLKDPVRRNRLAADWSRAGLAVEEFLRFVSPVQFSKPRYVRRDVDLEGVKLKKGDR
jgi:cytochrome P450